MLISRTSQPPVLTFGTFSVPFSNFPAARESRKSFPFESFHPVFLIFCSTPQLKNMDSDEMLQFFCKFEADKPFLTCRQRPMELYHGSYTAIPSPKILEGSFTKDFGNGFYCTSLKRQAIKGVRRYDMPVLNLYEYQLDHTLDILHFEKMTDEWLDFIVDCRSGKPHSHDIVIGAMANDQIYNYVADFMNGILTREQFWILAKFKYPTHQVSFCTQKALTCITYKGFEEVKE